MPTVLVADDNSNIQKMVGLALEEHGIAVVAVGNGEAAVRKLPDLIPDVVLADVFMPVRNGYEVCEFIKNDPKYSHIPVILLIGAFDPLDEKEVHRVGANGVLKKPFVPPDPLIAMVTGFIAGAEKRQAVTPAPQSVDEEKPALPPVVEATVEPEPLPEEFAFPSSPVSLQNDHDDPAPEPEEPVRDWRREAISFDVPEGMGASTSQIDEAEPASAAGSAPSEEATHPGEEARDWPPSPAIEPVPSQELAANPTEWLDMMSPHPEQSAAQELAHITGVPSDEFVPDTPPDESAPSAEISSEPPPELLSQPAAVIPIRPHTEPQPAPPAPFEELPADPSAFELAAFEKQTFPDTPLPEIPGFTDQAASHVDSYSQEPGAEHEPLPDTSFAQSDAFPAPQAQEPSFGQVDTYPAAPPVDAATIEVIIARVLERIEPQIHDILTREVLRPLAESLLQQELQKK